MATQFCSVSIQLIFAAVLRVKLREMSVTMLALKYALLVSRRSQYGYFLKLADGIFFNNTINLRHFNSMYYIVLCPQSGDRIVTVFSVTSLHPAYPLRCGLKVKKNHLSSPLSKQTVYRILPASKGWIKSNKCIAYHFFSWTDSTDSPDCLPILLSISVFSLYSSCFPLLVFLAVD